MKKSVLCFNPLVVVLDEVFDHEAAKAAINAGKDSLTQAPVIGNQGKEVSEKRTNSHAVIDQWSFSILSDLVSTISSVVRLPPENCEAAKLLHYVGEQYFDVHQDAFDIESAQKQLEDGGQRVFTTLCYLNDVDEGGQTAFPNLKLSVRPKLGRVLLFSNLAPGKNVRHRDSAHVGFGPEKGEKWVLSLWWRERIYHKNRIYPQEDGPFREI